MTQALSELTTIRVGGEPKEILRCTTAQELIDTSLKVWKTGDPWLLLGSGSNLVIADEVSDLTVIKVETRGITKSDLGSKQVWRVQAGENWDELVAETAKAGLAGIEAMSGIPGTVGAGPVQNIGAYGQELSDTILRAEFLDYETYELSILEAKDFAFGYRDSSIKRGRTGVITWVEFELLNLEGLSRPLYSTQIAADLDAEMGQQVPLDQVRKSVLKLRSQKGMLLDQDDANSVSCGSFFTNPMVSDSFARTLPADAPKWDNPEDDGLSVKLSAAWLIEQAGIEKGFSLPGSKAAVSSKHTLAIVNLGGATAQEITELARFIQERVAARFGLNLIPEPNLIGF
jgi:UDP-N-acetylmuramate dehydrogenase